MNPVPGKNYTVVAGDSLSLIAGRAYGDISLWPRIQAANQVTLKSGDPNLVFPGEIIVIPILSERQTIPDVPRDRGREVLTLELGGLEVRPTSGRVIRTIDTIANAFEVVIPWEAGDNPDLDALINPYSYTPVKVWVGKEKVIEGVLYKVAPSNSGGGTIALGGATPTVDLVDSKLKPPYEYNKTTFKDLITALVEPKGFTVVFNVEVPGVMDRVTATASDTVFGFLSRLAKQQGALLSCDTQGNVVVTRAVVAGTPVATIEEGVTRGVTGWAASFDGRQRFSVYRAVGRGPAGNIEAKVVDPAVPRSRFQTVSADEATAGDIEAAARWARNKTLADALSFTLTVPGWEDESGALWQENMLVTVISPTMFIPDGFDFLIKQVEYEFNSSGIVAKLSLVPPTVYTQGEIVEPWST